MCGARFALGTVAVLGAPVRCQRSLGPLPRRRLGSAATAAAIFILLVSLPLYAADVPILQGNRITVGAKITEPVPQPSDPGFSQASAASSNVQVAQINSIRNTGGFSSVNFTVTGLGVAVVTVTYTNPTTNGARRQYFVVASGVSVVRASRIVMSTGDTIAVPEHETIQANAYVGDDAIPSTAIVSPAVVSDGVQITSQSVGTSFVYIQLQSGSNLPLYEVVIVTVTVPGTLQQ